MNNKILYAIIIILFLIIVTGWAYLFLNQPATNTPAPSSSPIVMAPTSTPSLTPTTTATGSSSQSQPSAATSTQPQSSGSSSNSSTVTIAKISPTSGPLGTLIYFTGSGFKSIPLPSSSQQFPTEHGVWLEMSDGSSWTRISFIENTTIYSDNSMSIKLNGNFLPGVYNIVVLDSYGKPISNTVTFTITPVG